MQLKERAVEYMMEILTTEFPSLYGMHTFVPPRTTPHPITKAEVVPMKILHMDEKHKRETIQILSELMDYANLQGDMQVCVVCGYTPYSHTYSHIHV